MQGPSIDISNLPHRVDKNIALKLYDIGFIVIPIKLIREGDRWRKIPVIEWGEFEERDQERREVETYYWRTDGIAILTGIKLRGTRYYIGALDFDDAEAFEKVKHSIPETYIERTPRGGYHAVYLCEEQPKLTQYRREGERGEVFSVLGITPNGKPKLCTVYPSQHYSIVNSRPLAIVKNLNAIANRTAHELGLLKPEGKDEKTPKTILEKRFEKIKPHLNIAKETSNCYLIHCPFHPPDEHPSFLIYKNTYLAIDFHDGKTYTLKELARALNIELFEKTHLGSVEVNGRMINFVRIEDNYDEIVSEIAETDETQQLIEMLEDPETKISMSEKAYLLANAITSVITFVRVVYGEDAKLWYFDGYTLSPRSNELINIIVRRLLTPYKAVSVHVVNETYRNISAFAPIEVTRGSLDSVKYLPFKNTALDLETLEPISYEELAKRKAFFTAQLKYTLDMDLLNRIKNDGIGPEEIAPEFHKFLSRFYEGEDLTRIQLTLGYILSPYQGKKPIVLVIGPPDTGKSTLKEVLYHTLFPFVSSSSLDDIMTDFGLAPLVGRRANISSEKPSLTVNSERIKRITGGEVLMVNEKFKPQYPAVINPILIHLMNDPPKFSHLDDALVDRVVIIRTTNAVQKEERDATVLERLKREGEKIMHYLIWCYKKLRDAGFIIPQDRDDVYDTLLAGRSNVKKFLNDVVEFKANAEIKGTDLYNAYLRWCGENGEKALGIRAFYEDVIYFGMGRIIKKEKQRSVYFVGITIKRKESENGGGPLDKFVEAKSAEVLKNAVLNVLVDTLSAQLVEDIQEELIRRGYNVAQDKVAEICELLVEEGEVNRIKLGDKVLYEVKV